MEIKKTRSSLYTTNENNFQKTPKILNEEAIKRINTTFEKTCKTECEQFDALCSRDSDCRGDF